MLMADIVTNHKGRRDYHILETFEAGIALLGTEVKAIREGRVNLRDSFARIEDGGALFVGEVLYASTAFESAALLPCLASSIVAYSTFALFITPQPIFILPNITYIHYENVMPRRIYTDGRNWPTDEEPTFVGYSIGKWIDQDGDGRYDLLEVETRQFKGPRTMDESGIPLHADNQTIVKERIYLDRADKDAMHNDITVIDHAFTGPWTVTKTYQRIPNDKWYEDNCNEENHHIIIGKDNYFVSADGYLMPSRKDQAPPDLRYFRQTRK